MKSLKLLERLKRRPIFEIEDVIRITNRDREYIRLLLHRLEKRNLIYRIERGKYTVHKDPLVFGTYLVHPSYFSLWTALRFYDLTTQLPNTFSIMVPRSKESLEFNSAKLNFTKTKYMFGFSKVKYKDFKIFMAEKEKLLLDCLLTHKVKVDELTELIKKVDRKKVLRYVLRIDNSSLAKRVGYLLELEGKKARKMKSIMDSNYVLLDTNLPERGEKNKEWKVIDNR